MWNLFFANLWQVLLDLSPSLLLGLFLAGLLHVWVPEGVIHRQMNRVDFPSVLRAVLIGIPLPLCSCGVIPTGLGLRREGASKGAVTGFIISTPQTGVDSILVSASFLGWPFALFKVAAALVTGLLGGLLVNLLVKNEAPPPVVVRLESKKTGWLSRLEEIVRFALFDLLALIDLWILAGVVVAALITTWVPPDYFASLGWVGGMGGMLLMLLIAIPMYVCTTGSVPIAASLIQAGLPLGSALVFLLAGPTTNVATIGAVYRGLGGRVMAIYLGVVAVMSLLLGWLFDFLLGDSFSQVTHHHHESGADAIQILSAGLVSLLLMGLIVRRLLHRWRPPEISEQKGELSLQVAGMTCPHCVANVKRSLESVAGVEEARPDLASGRVWVRGVMPDRGALTVAVERAGFRVVDS
ncbi:MAG: permease [Pseudomonadota bacterium]